MKHVDIAKEIFLAGWVGGKVSMHRTKQYLERFKHLLCHHGHAHFLFGGRGESGEITEE